MEQLYVLQLAGGKYYVGKTKNVADRYKQHISGGGAAWTRKYTPTKLIETRGLKGEHDETNVTKDLMKKYGVDNVRGGAYVTVTLDEATKSVLEREIRGNGDKCFKCGLDGHFASQCPVTIREVVVWECAYCPKQFKTERACQSHEDSCGGQIESACYRCGRNSHHASTCYAKTHIDGEDIEEESEEDSGDCSRCGRDGHGSSECYAKRHVDGSKL
jgi:predicted GIY-YIG superfamily endonuclease